MAGAAVGGVLDELVVGYNLEVIVHLQAVHHFHDLFVFVPGFFGFLVDVGGCFIVVGGALEDTVGDAEEVVFAAGDKLQVGAQAQLSGVPSSS